MGEFYTYQKKRREYGKFCNFSDTEIKHWFIINPPTVAQYIQRDPNFIDLDNIPELTEHVVNTERVSTKEQGMAHKEGGWPATVADPSESTETNKFRKRVERDPNFTGAVKELCTNIEHCLKQNNQIDLFEEYFFEEESEHFVESISTKTLMLFKDQSENVKRTVSEISWYPDAPTKVAVSYSILRFQQMPDSMPLQSYVWDLNNPNVPDLVLSAPSSITNISYNQKLSDQIGGGCYNGLITIWDVKKGKDPIMVSPVEKSHSDPISHILWLSSRTGTELVTTSTDGKVYWWDTRKFNEGPVDQLNLTETFINPDGSKNDRSVGGTVIEYNTESGPNKFLIGTEQGTILTANRRVKKPVEITTKYGMESGRHLGPVYAINRSLPNPRYFLSVGDWSAKIWFEDLKTPIIRTKYHGSYLSDGCFSPTRNGVFFLTRRDGWLDIWDYYYRQNELAFSHKVSDSALSCIKINVSGGGYHNTGKLVAIGDQDGTVTLMELCDSLYMLQPKEKEIISEMFDRETRKEKILDQMKKAAEKKGGVHKEPPPKKDLEAKKQEMLKKIDESFFKDTKKGETEEDKFEEQLASELLQKKSKKEEEEKKPEKSEKSEEKEKPKEDDKPAKEKDKETPTKEVKEKEGDSNEQPLKEEPPKHGEEKKIELPKEEEKPKEEESHEEKEKGGDPKSIKDFEKQKTGDKEKEKEKTGDLQKGMEKQKTGGEHEKKSVEGGEEHGGVVEKKPEEEKHEP